MLAQMKSLFAKHPRASIIWAHAGLGRIVRPVHEQLALLAKALDDPELQHVNIDISWDEVAKYVVASLGQEESGNRSGSGGCLVRERKTA